MVDFCVEYNLSFKETSAKTGYNVRETFDEFAESKEFGYFVDIYDWREKHGEESWSSDKHNGNSVSLDREKSSGEGPDSVHCRCC